MNMIKLKIDYNSKAIYHNNQPIFKCNSKKALSRIAKMINHEISQFSIDNHLLPCKYKQHNKTIVDYYTFKFLKKPLIKTIYNYNFNTSVYLFHNSLNNFVNYLTMLIKSFNH